MEITCTNGKRVTLADMMTLVDLTDHAYEFLFNLLDAEQDIDGETAGRAASAAVKAMCAVLRESMEIDE